MQEVAQIARTFRLDPAALLRDGGDDFPHLLRLAAADYIAEREAQENAKMEREAKSKSR
ncbi:MAG: hypothetical protein ACRDTZ_04685 [Pseudonocardiaceae bacterium]